MSNVIVQAGCSARAVSSAGEVDLLGVGSTFSADGVALANAQKWSLCITTTQDVTVRLYKAAGPNAGLVKLTALDILVTSATPLIREFVDECNVRIRVTAQAASTTAAVNCDFRAVGDAR